MPDSIIAATTLAQKIRLCSKNFGHYRDVIPGKVTPFYD
jgi:predicted nucleic acid-binding protein